MTLLVALSVVLLAVAVRLAVPVLRRWQVARELRGDWWPRFEHDFRWYSHQLLQSAREAEHRGG